MSRSKYLACYRLMIGAVIMLPVILPVLVPIALLAVAKPNAKLLAKPLPQLLTKRRSPAAKISRQSPTPKTVLLKFKKRRLPTPKISRPAGDQVCQVTPGVLEPSTIGPVLWQAQPLFLWQNQTDATAPQTIRVIHAVTNEILWEQSIAADVQSVIYAGTALQPSQSYRWQLFRQAAQSPTGTGEIVADRLFQLMEPAQRQQLETELQAFGATQGNPATVETVALQQADYLIEQDRFSDALTILYTVPQPSAALRTMQQDLVNDVCPP